MPIQYVVEQGDSISKLVGRFGLTRDTIWHHPNNDDLRTVRSRFDALLPGDIVFIPDIREKHVDRVTNQRHVFRRVGVPILFELQLFDVLGKPRKNRPYKLDVDDAPRSGQTDENGYLKQFIPNGARRGRLVIEDELDLPILFGDLDPIETLSGVQRRLTNMGFSCLADDGQTGRLTTRALLDFQQFARLPATGTLDDQTREAIPACHDDRGKYRQMIEQNTSFAFI